MRSCRLQRILNLRHFIDGDKLPTLSFSIQASFSLERVREAQEEWWDWMQNQLLQDFLLYDKIMKSLCGSSNIAWYNLQIISEPAILLKGEARWMSLAWAYLNVCFEGWLVACTEITSTIYSIGWITQYCTYNLGLVLISFNGSTKRKKFLQLERCKK